MPGGLEDIISPVDSVKGINNREVQSKIIQIYQIYITQIRIVYILMDQLILLSLIQLF